MPGAARRVVAVLFLDIVGSTTIAGELGDEGWRSLLSRFRAVVRVSLKHHGGREVDTAGDGFFATFADPLPAIRAGFAIAQGVQELGLEVRVGIHAGEVELEGSRVAGMNVHIAARAMAIAGPAQIVVTRTVRDLEHGSPIVLAEAGTHRLKGVEGEWQLYTVTSVDGEGPVAPLEPRGARERRRLHARPSRTHRRLVAGAVLAVVLLVSGVAWATRSSAPPRPPSPQRLLLLKIDPQTARPALQVWARDENSYLAAPADVGGALLRPGTGAVEQRDMASGEIGSSFPVPGLTFIIGTAGSTWTRVGIGGGELWVGSGVLLFGSTGWTFDSFDASSGARGPSATAPDGVISDPVYGPGGFWFLSAGADLSRLDPTAPKHVKPLPTADWAGDAQLTVPYPHGVWLVGADRLVWYDTRTERHRAISLRDGESAIVEGVDAYSFDRVWVLDTVDQTVTPLGDGREEPSRTIGVLSALPNGSLGEYSGQQQRFVHAATSIDGYLWVAAGSSVVGIPRRGTRQPVSVGMPTGFRADYLVGDRASGSLWVGSCYCDDWWGIRPV